MVRFSRVRSRTPQHCTAVTEAFLFLGVSCGSMAMTHYHGTTRGSSGLLPERPRPFAIESTGRCATFGRWCCAAVARILT
jgi:hypothetical protein